MFWKKPRPVETTKDRHYLLIEELIALTDRGELKWEVELFHATRYRASYKHWWLSIVGCNDARLHLTNELGDLLHEFPATPNTVSLAKRVVFQSTKVDLDGFYSSVIDSTP